jgi:hypothetical protein
MATGATGYGVIDTGFYAKPLSIVDDEVDQDLRTILGESAGTNDDGKIPIQSMAGQLKSLLVDGFGAHWDLLEAVYASVDPNKNTGDSQDAVGSISGVVRNGAQYSIATGICAGTANTVLTAGRVATVAGTGSRFSSLIEKTMATGTAYFNLFIYSEGAIVTNNNRIYRATVGGTTDVTPAPSGTSAAFVDGTVTWKYCGEGNAYAAVPFAAEDVGAVGALTGSMTGIATPVDGWSTVLNPMDAAQGRARETDAAYRLRREEALATAGNTTVEAIRANVLAVNADSNDPLHEPATSCDVLFNDTDATNSDGLPPHSVHIIVLGGTDADIELAIWESVGAGTYMYGTSVATVVDTQGNNQTVRYTRPTEIPIWVTGTLKYDPTQWPAGSTGLIVQSALSAFLTYTADWPASRDVRRSPLEGAIMRGPSETDDDGNAVVPANEDADPVPGMLEIENLYFGIATGPTASTQITIAKYQIATFSSANTTFTAESEEA